MWGPYFFFLDTGLFTFLVDATAATPVVAPTALPVVFPTEGARDVEREALAALCPAFLMAVARFVSCAF